jgi:hypothetical protein
MTDAVIPPVYPRGRRHFRKSGPDWRDPVAGTGQPPASRSRDRADPAPPAVTIPRTVRCTFAWLLDILTIGFAYGGCIHHRHPDYLEFLSDIGAKYQHKR